jgi:transcriptional regulator with XRE-family HTH domain
MAHFGQSFRAILQRKNLSQLQAAALLGWTQTNVSYYCRQEKPPRPHIVAHMAKALGLSEAELLGQASTKQSVIVAETNAPTYGPSIDPWPAWGRLLRAAYRRDPAKIELAVRAAWPKEADQILAWLKD